MRILFTSLRNTGHFQPVVPFIEACRERHHQVAVAAPGELAQAVARLGAAFYPVAHPGDDVLRPIWARLGQLSAEEANRLVVGEIFAGVNAAAALPGLLASCEAFRPDLLIRESQEYAAPVAAQKLGLPHARVGIMLGAMELACFGAAAAALDRLRASVGLPPDPQAEQLLAEPVLTLFPGSLEPDLKTQLPVQRFHTPHRSGSALPAWWGARDEPLVYVTLGTVAGGMEATRQVYRKALEAVGALPVRALLTTGSELPLELLGPLPPNLHVERFVPQADLLPHCAAVLCHGGSGTLLGALAHGLPLVVLPMFADQPLNAGRVQALGAGLALQPMAASADELRAALTRVLEEASFRDAATRLADEMAAQPSVADAPDVLARWCAERAS